MSATERRPDTEGDTDTETETETETETGTDTDGEPSWRAIPRRLLTLAGVAFVFSVLVQALGRLHWILELTTHFVVAQALAGPVLVALALWTSVRRSVVFAVVVVGIVQIARVAAVWLPAEHAADEQRPTLGLLLVNVERINPDRASLLRYWEQKSPDLVALVEVDAGWLADVADVADGYPHRVEVPNDLNLGLAIYSMHPITAVERVPVAEPMGLPGPEVGEDVLWALDVTLEVESEHLRLILVHAYPPVGSELSALRDRVLLEVADRAGRSETPTVLAGDFNATPWSPIFEDMLALGGLLDSRQGVGVHGTWGPGHLLPIDHVLHDPHLVTIDREIGPEVGSDHLPVWIELAWRAE